MAGLDHEIKRVDPCAHRHDHLLVHPRRFVDGVDHLQRFVAILCIPPVNDLVLDPVGQFVSLTSAAFVPLKALA